MTTSGAIFSIMNVLIRDISQATHPLQGVFFRNFFGWLMVCAFIFVDGKSLFQTKRIKVHMLRSMTGLVAMYLWFMSVTYLPQAKATALSFTMPFFALIGAALFLRETIRIRRWTATLVGFIGALIILQPWRVELSLLDCLPIVAAFFIAGSLLLVKNLSGSERPNTMLFYMGFFMSTVSLGPAIYVWQPVPNEIWLKAVLLGFIAFLAHQSIVRAFRLADASAVTPFDFLRLPFAAMAAFAFFGEVPEVQVWVGAAVIAASSCYIAWRESQLSKKEVSPD
jgi:drug/metabolite transporter (DMT)-like permease